MQRCFGGVIYRSENVWSDCGHGTDVDDQPFGSDEERNELQGDGDDGEEVCFECESGVVSVYV
jgi:hypothetical protein